MASKKKRAQEWWNSDWVVSTLRQVDEAAMQTSSNTGIELATQAVLTEALKTRSVDDLERFLALVEFKRAMFRRAVELLPRVWNNFEALRTRFGLRFEHPTRGVLAALYTCRNQSAIGAFVLRMCERYMLVISPKMETLSPEAQDKVLLHELCHMGYGGHDEKFRAHCAKVGGVVSGAAASGAVEPGVYVEWKPPGAARYTRHPQKFESQAEATAFAQQEIAARRSGGLAPGRWRLVFA